jgi:hypothetical protein
MDFDEKELHRQEIRSLEAAHRAGQNPYTYGAENFGATRGTRGGMIVFRGKKHWEVVLGTVGEVALSADVDDFQCAADAVLPWLDGGSSANVLERVNGHLVRATGADAGVAAVSA